MKVPGCPYCLGEAVLVGGRQLYPGRDDLADKDFWACRPCAAWVGCYPGGAKPMGRLADAELRRAKQEAHAAFDPFWRSGRVSRARAYAWLAKALGLPPRLAHIGMMDLATCRHVVALCRAKKESPA